MLSKPQNDRLRTQETENSKTGKSHTLSKVAEAQSFTKKDSIFSKTQLLIFSVIENGLVSAGARAHHRRTARRAPLHPPATTASLARRVAAPLGTARFTQDPARAGFGRRVPIRTHRIGRCPPACS